MKNVVTLGPTWAVLGITIFLWFTQGCSNEGKFARNEKPTKDEPTVIVVRQVPTVPVVVPVPTPAPVEFSWPDSHVISGCHTCCFTLEEIQTALSECKDEKRRDHAICMYDKLFEYHNHEVTNENN